MTTRTDNHRPSIMNPSEYRWVLSFAYPGPSGDRGYHMAELGALRAANPGRFFQRAADDEVCGCDVCGSWYLEGSVFQHQPTGEYVQIGNICADKVDLYAGDLEGLEAARRERKALSMAKRDRANRWGQYRAVLAAQPELRQLLRVDHPIARDVRARFKSSPFRCIPSEKQVALLERLHAAALAPPAEAEKHVPVPVDGERIMVEGLVVSTKVSEGYYGMTCRMTVKVETPDGSWLVNGTEPRGLCTGPLKGHRVRLMATVTKGGRDEHFGFFKRPTKAEIIG